MECFSRTSIPVVEKRITGQLFPVVGQDGTVQQMSLSGNGIIRTQFRVNVVIVAPDIRRTYNIGHLAFGIVLKGIGCQSKLRILQLHIIVEHRLLGSRTVLSPLGSQHVLFVHQCSAIKKIPQVIYPVIVQAIGKQRRVPVFHTYIHTHFGNLRISVIVKPVTIQEQGISLIHLYITERFE